MVMIWHYPQYGNMLWFLEFDANLHFSWPALLLKRVKASKAGNCIPTRLYWAEVIIAGECESPRNNILIYSQLFQYILLYNQPIANTGEWNHWILTLLVHEPLSDDTVDIYADAQHIFGMHCIIKKDLQDAEQYVHINKLKHWTITRQNWYVKTAVHIADSQLCMHVSVCMHAHQGSSVCLRSTPLTPT